jgi:hypothetical protein
MMRDEVYHQEYIAYRELPIWMDRVLASFELALAI